MKHIFIVHSPITYLAALGVIIKEKLIEDDVLILSETFRLKYEPIEILDICKSKTTKLKRILSFAQSFFSPYKTLDFCLGNFLKDDFFIAYIPVFHYLDRYLVTHPKCNRFNFIEEGLAAYYDYFTYDQHTFVTVGHWRYTKSYKGVKERISEIWRIIRGYSSKIDAIPTFYSAYAADPNILFYGFHERSHHLAITKKLLSFDDISSHYKLTTSCTLDDAFIWIGDPDIYLKAENTEVFIQSISEGYIAYLKQKKIKFTYIKFHYRDSDFIKKKTIDEFIKNGIEVEIISDSVILEIELLRSKNVTLFGFYSSLLLYGGMMGHTSYSIVKFAPYCLNKVDKQISDFWKFVKIHY